jgi:tRNA pseudouridine38-40 synthase
MPLAPCPFAMRNLRLVLRYDGTDFQGWQTQPGFRTVQETLETAIAAVTRGERVRANPSGRTDAGVHALGQVVNFYSATRLGCDVLARAINAHLPPDVCVRTCDEVPQAFCANKDAVRKTYRYVIYDGRPHDPFSRRYACHSRRRLDAAAMLRASQCLLGRHDFRSFETDWPNRLSSIRTITRLDVVRSGEFVRIEVEADGFLYNMVRAIAGTLMQVGRGYWPEGRVAEVLAARDRRVAGPTAPPQGLFLLRVTYPDRLRLPCDPGAGREAPAAMAEVGAVKADDQPAGGEGGPGVVRPEPGADGGEGLAAGLLHDEPGDGAEGVRPLGGELLRPGADLLDRPADGPGDREPRPPLDPQPGGADQRGERQVGGRGGHGAPAG